MESLRLNNEGSFPGAKIFQLRRLLGISSRLPTWIHCRGSTMTHVIVEAPLAGCAATVPRPTAWGQRDC